MNIAELDPNMNVVTTLPDTDLVWLDVRKEPFDLYGFYNPRGEEVFRRVPKDVAERTSKNVASLAVHTAGGRVRFCTDSAKIAIKAEMHGICKMDHFPITGSAGFDLFVCPENGEDERYATTFRPAFEIEDGYESVKRFGTRQKRYFTINFPPYSGVKNLYIGLQNDATVDHGMKYLDAAPIVYYGSSITQGGCASRPGNIYQNIVCRSNRIDYLNLGFSGSGKGEDAIVEYMANLDMSVFVSDYDHNAPNAEHLKKTHCNLYQKIREKHPDIPYIMLSKPDIDQGGYQNGLDRREVILETYRFARANGDRNVYFIDGNSIFRGAYSDAATVDGTHPNDLGMWLMAQAIIDELKRARTQSLM